MKYLYISLIIAHFCTFSSCSKDKMAGEWQGDTYIKHYGHVYNQQAADIIKTPDNGFLILGTSSSFASANASNNDRSFMNKMYLIKTDSIGNELWSKTYGNEDVTVTAKQLMYNNDSSAIYLLGTSQKVTRLNNTSSLGPNRMQIFKIDLAGEELEASRAYPATNSPYNYEFVSATNVDNSVFLIAGTTTEIKENKTGPDLTVDVSDHYSMVLYHNNLNLKSTIHGGIVGPDRLIKVFPHPSDSVRVFHLVNSIPKGGQPRLRIISYHTMSGLPSNTTDGRLEDTDEKYLATDAITHVINNENYITILTTKNEASNLDFTNPTHLGFIQLKLDGVNDNRFIRIPSTSPPINSFGSATGNSYAVTSANILSYPNNNGYLVSSTAIKASGINSDIQLTRYNNNFEIMWSQYYGSGASMDKGSKVFLIDSLLPNSNITTNIGIGAIGTFDFGSNNTMIGLMKMNTVGELRAHE